MKFSTVLCVSCLHFTSICDFDIRLSDISAIKVLQQSFFVTFTARASALMSL